MSCVPDTAPLQGWVCLIINDFNCDTLLIRTSTKEVKFLMNVNNYSQMGPML